MSNDKNQKTTKNNDSSMIQTIENIDAYFETKNFLGPCVEAFQKNVLKSTNYHDIKDKVIEHCLQGSLQETLLRPTAWKILLGIFPCDITTTLSDWVEITKKNRIEYMKKKQVPLAKKLKKGDPLNPDNDSSTWNIYFKDQSLKKIIDIDIQRTYQDKKLFCENIVKEILCSVLFIWSRENSELSYKQGMNEIAALLLYALFPFYFPFGNKEDSLKLITKEMLINPLPDSRIIYTFFHDEAYFEADLFYLFNAVMKGGLISLYSTKKVNKPAKMMELFDDIYAPNDYDNENADWIYRRCGLIIKNKLFVYDEELYKFFEKSNIDCATFMQRWLKCLFCREFPLKDSTILWDVILAQERIAITNKINKDYEFVDYISVAMLVHIRDQVIGLDPNDCLLKLFKYPKVDSPQILVKLAMKIQNNLEMRKNALKIINENKKTIMSGRNSLKKEINSKIIKKEEENKTKFQKNYLPLPNSIHSYLNAKPSQDKQLIETIKEKISNQNKQIIERLDEIKNKYRRSYSEEDRSDFEFLIEILKKKLE